MAEYTDGPMPNPSVHELEAMSVKVGREQRIGRLVETCYGSCDFGVFGTALFTRQHWAHAQVWYLSDGRDFILATYISRKLPLSEELYDIDRMVKGLSLEEVAADVLFKR